MDRRTSYKGRIKTSPYLLLGHYLTHILWCVSLQELVGYYKFELLRPVPLLPLMSLNCILITEGDRLSVIISSNCNVK